MISKDERRKKLTKDIPYISKVYSTILIILILQTKKLKLCEEEYRKMIHKKKACMKIMTYTYEDNTRD